MTELYENRLYVKDLRKTDKSLFSVLTDTERSCIVYRMVGVDMNFVNYDLEALKVFGEEGAEKARGGRVDREEFAVNYVRVVESGESVMVDHTHKRHFIINPEEKKILVIKKDHPYAFYYARIASQGGAYIYKGTLMDGLKEFQEHNYRFYEAEIGIYPKYEQKEEIKDLESLVN